MPWIHIYANPDGSVLPCCIGDHRLHLGNVQENSIIEIWNNDKYKAMRLKMLAGERCNECSACYQNEDNNVHSFRETVNRDYSKFISIANNTNLDGSLNEMNLKYLDVRWSNICNLKCRSCSSTFSSSWATEDNKQGQDKKVFLFAGGESNDRLYEQFLPHIDGIQEIYFAGGEPLLMDKHYDLLDHLIATGNTDIKLRYSTNITNLTYKKTHITEYWNKFSKVHVYASLDSWSTRAEYIREGTVWSDIENNIKTIREKSPHVQLEMATVISAFNVSTLPEFLDYLINNELFSKNMNPSFYCLINPDYYSFNVINDDLKNTIINKLSNVTYGHGISNQIKNVISSLKNSKYDERLYENFLVKNKHYDQIRNRDFTKTFPELIT